MNAQCLPPDVATKLDKFCAESKTGSLRLDIKDGRILGAHLVEDWKVRNA